MKWEIWQDEEEHSITLIPAGAPHYSDTAVLTHQFETQGATDTEHFIAAATKRNELMGWEPYVPPDFIGTPVRQKKIRK